MGSSPKSKAIFIIGLLFFSLLSSINIGNPISTIIEDESSPQTSGDGSTTEMVKPSQVDFTSDRMMISQGEGSHTPLAVDVYGDMVCQGGFFSGSIQLKNTRFDANGVKGYIHCDTLHGELALAFTPPIGSNVAKVQDVKIFNSTNLVVVGTFKDGTITGSFISSIEIGSLLIPSVTTSVINHCLDSANSNIRHFEILKVDGILNQSYAVGTIRNYGASGNELCTANPPTPVWNQGVNITSGSDKRNQSTTNNKSFMVNFSPDGISGVHLLENDDAVHFTSLEYVGPNEVYISYYLPAQGSCTDEDYYTEAGYFIWNGTNLIKGSHMCGENLKFRDLTKSGTNVYLIGDAMSIVDCVPDHTCTGSGGLDVVVYNANQSKGVLLGGQLLDYGFSIDSHESELIIGGSFESVVSSLGLSSNDEEDGFVASIHLTSANFTLNWANGVGGIGIDLITDVAIDESNGNVFVAGMISESGQAGSVNYNAGVYEHLETKSFVGYLNVSNVLPVPIIHSYQSIQVTLASTLSAKSTVLIHHLQVDEYDLIEYRFNDSDMSNLTIEYMNSRIYVNETTTGSNYTSLFLVMEPGLEMPVGYFIAENSAEYGMCSLDNQYFTILCSSGSSSKYLEYSPVSGDFESSSDEPKTDDQHLWSSESMDYCSSGNLKAKGTMFAHINHSTIAFVDNESPHNLSKYDILNCSSTLNSSNTMPSTIEQMSGSEEGKFFIRTTTYPTSGLNCRNDTYNIYNRSLELIYTKVIEYCGDSSGYHIYNLDSSLHGKELHISSSFGPEIQTVSVNSTPIYDRSNVTANVSHIMIVDLDTTGQQSNIIYSENKATTEIGVLDEGVIIACLRSLDDGSLGHINYGDDFSQTTDKNSICMAMGSNDEYSSLEFNSIALSPTSYGFDRISDDHWFNRSVYSFMDVNTNVTGVAYDGRTIFVDYKTNISIQFKADPTKMQPNKWSMTTLPSNTAWLHLNESTGELTGAYTAYASNVSDLPCSEYTITAAYETSDDQEAYEAHYSHAVEICVQSVVVNTITYGSDNNLSIRYGNQTGLSSMPVYSGGPIDHFTLTGPAGFTGSTGVSIDNVSGLLTVDGLQAESGQYTVGYNYTHNGAPVHKVEIVNISVNYTIQVPLETDRYLMSPHMESKVEFNLRDTALINNSLTNISYTPPSDASFACPGLNANAFDSTFDSNTRILTITSDKSAANNCSKYTENAGTLQVKVGNSGANATLLLEIETVPMLSDNDVYYPDRYVEQVFGVFSVAPEYKGQTFVCTDCLYQLETTYRAGISMNQSNITYVAHRGPIIEQFTVRITYPNASGLGDKTINASFNLTTNATIPHFERTKMEVELIAGQAIYYPPESPRISNPLKWTILAGSLPIGLSIDNVSGVISGKTSNIGTHTVTVNAKSTHSTHSASYTLSLHVIAPPSEAHYATDHVNVYGGVEMNPIMLQNNVNNIGDWVAHITLPNGQQEIGWGLSDTHLGLSIDGNGTISGTPVWDVYDNSTYDDLIELHVRLSPQDENINSNNPDIQISIHKPTFETPYFDDDNIEISTVLGAPFVFNPPTAHAKISQWDMQFADNSSESDWDNSDLTFDEKTGSISGISKTNTMNMRLIITGTTNVQQQDSFNLNITILNPSLDSVYYNHTTLHLFKNKTMKDFAPVGADNRSLSFVAIPELPNGLSIDSSTGVISGKPELNSTDIISDSEATYEIIVSEDYTENFTMELVIHIHDIRADLSFALDETSVSFVEGEYIDFELQYPGRTGTLSWSTSELPEGLTLFTENNSSWIRGTPTVLGTSNIQVSVSDSSSGATTMYTQNISVVEKNPILHYAMDKIYLHLGQDLDGSPICPHTKISIDHYEIDPTPIANLEFNTSTGCISGVPSVVSNSASPYSITGYTQSGQFKTVELQLIVSGLRSDYFLVDTPALQLIDYNDIIHYPYRDQDITYGSYLANDSAQSKIGQLSQFTIDPDISILGDDVYFDTTTGTLSGLPTNTTTDGGIIFTISAIWQYRLADDTFISTEVSTEYKIIVKSGELYHVDDKFVVGGKLSIKPSVEVLEFDEYKLYGKLPMGVLFDTETGVLSGTPQESGTFAFRIVASSDDGRQVDYYVDFEIEERENNPRKVVFIFAILGLLFTVMRFVNEKKESSHFHTTKNSDKHHDEEE